MMMGMDILVFLFACLCLILNLFFCYQSIAVLIERKEGIVYQILLLIACLFVPQMIMHIGDLDNLPPTMFLFIGVIWFCCKGSPWKRVTVAVLVCVAAFSYSALIDNYLLTGYLASAARILFWAVIWLVLRSQLPPKKYQMSDTMWKLIFLLTLTPLAIVLSIMLLQSSSYSQTQDGAATSNMVLLLIAILSLIGLFQVIPVLARKEKLEEENQLNQWNQAYYENLEKQQLEIRILRHDMVNHLQVLASLTGNARDTYLRDLISGPVLKKSVFFCENKILNGVINAKLSAIEKAKIPFTADIHVAEIPVDDVDLCAVFANGLDNAIESCQKRAEKERFIKIQARAEKGIFVLRIVNAAQVVDTKNGIPKTSKASAQYHGFGLRSMETIVQRYDGEMELTAEDGQFSLFLYLRFPKK